MGNHWANFIEYASARPVLWWLVQATAYLVLVLISVTIASIGVQLLLSAVNAYGTGVIYAFVAAIVLIAFSLHRSGYH